MFQEKCTPEEERELTEEVQKRGGLDVVRQNDVLLRAVYAARSRRKHTAAMVKLRPGDHEIKAQLRKERTTDGPASHTFGDLKRELSQNWEDAVKHNMEVFEKKFSMLKNDLSDCIHQENLDLVNTLNQGPHDLINHRVCCFRLSSGASEY